MATEVHATTASGEVGVLRALRAHWIIALVPVMLLVAAAVRLGLVRTPEYTATSTVTVGRVFMNNPAGVASVLEGTESLASVYSRAIDANAVRDDVARRLAKRAVATSGKLSATPIPDSPLIRLTAVGSSPDDAIELANAGSAALVDYVAAQERSGDEADAISRRYERATLRYRRQLDARERLAEQYDRDPTLKNRAAFDRAAAATDTTQLRRNALLASYQNVVQGTSSRPPVEIFATAMSAKSDRDSMLQLLVFIGFIGGLAAGASLALLRAQRRARRGSAR